ncbi:MAG: capsule biosynthesis protein, partial [Pseudomonadota bacterium]
MTTKPRASKFRIKRGSGTRPSAASTGGAEGADGAPEQPARPAPQQAATRRPSSVPPQQAAAPRPQGAPAQNQPGPQAAQAPRQAQAARPRAGQVSSPAQVRGETSIDAIRKEGLTGRQLR